MTDLPQTREAGPELNALIAEKVMGLDLSSCAVDNGEGWCEVCGQEMPEWGRRHEAYWLNGAQVKADTPGCEYRLPRDGEYQPSRCRGYAYSTDISAAWLVVEKMREQEWGVQLTAAIESRWCAEFWQLGKQGGEQHADTLPLAICLAALQVVGVSSVSGTREAGRESPSAP